MTKRLKNLLQLPTTRYVLVGGVAYVIDVGVLIGLYDGGHTSRTLAAAVSFWAGLIISFVMQKLVAFQDLRREVKVISRQVFWYGLLVAFNYALTVAIVSVFPGRYIILSRTFAVAVTTLWNFVIYKRLVFSRPTEDNLKNQIKG